MPGAPGVRRHERILDTDHGGAVEHCRGRDGGEGGRPTPWHAPEGQPCSPLCRAEPARRAAVRDDAATWTHRCTAKALEARSNTRPGPGPCCSATLFVRGTAVAGVSGVHADGPSGTTVPWRDGGTRLLSTTRAAAPGLGPPTPTAQPGTGSGRYAAWRSSAIGRSPGLRAGPGGSLGPHNAPRTRTTHYWACVPPSLRPPPCPHSLRPRVRRQAATCCRRLEPIWGGAGGGGGGKGQPTVMQLQHESHTSQCATEFGTNLNTEIRTGRTPAVCDTRAGLRQGGGGARFCSKGAARVMYTIYKIRIPMRISYTAFHSHIADQRGVFAKLLDFSAAAKHLPSTCAPAERRRNALRRGVRGAGAAAKLRGSVHRQGRDLMTGPERPQAARTPPSFRPPPGPCPRSPKPRARQDTKGSTARENARDYRGTAAGNTCDPLPPPPRPLPWAGPPLRSWRLPSVQEGAEPTYGRGGRCREVCAQQASQSSPRRPPNLRAQPNKPPKPLPSVTKSRGPMTQTLRLSDLNKPPADE